MKPDNLSDYDDYRTKEQEQALKEIKRLVLRIKEQLLRIKSYNINEVILTIVRDITRKDQ